jgi:GNAT superfamily N-acetyltransferase
MVSDATLEIRAADQSDLNTLQDLYAHFDRTDDVPLQGAAADTAYTAMLNHPGLTLFGGFLGTEMVATCTLVVIPNLLRSGMPYALIENVVTHSLYRAKGYGRAVLQHAVAKAKAQGCYKVMLLTGSKRPEIHTFYEKSGFEQNKTGFQIRFI